MNQILSVESPKRENKKNRTRTKGPLEINSILRFFAVSLLIFGIFMVGNGSYSMYKDSINKRTTMKPTIYVEEISETELRLQVTHDKNLSKVSYSWNEEEATEIDCKGKKKVEQTIKIPTGDNTLNVYAVDIEGQEINYSRNYTLQGEINIDLEVDGNNIKILANGKNELSYMTYRWDDQDEERIEINSTQTEQTISIPKGLHTLTIIVVDINNKTETKEQEIKGVTKPKVEVTTDGSANFIIKASDEEGIKRVEFIINETDKKMLNLDQVLPLEQRKEFEYAYPLQEGENKLEVRVYNESDVSEVARVLVRK